ncbi:MAG TPA: hypothetical protein VGD58_08590, partial [Herpetosiphonaceae bacterium]
MPPIYEIRLIVDRTNDGYTASWIDPNSQRSTAFPLNLPLKPQNMDDLRWYLETYMQFPGAGDYARAKGIEDQLKMWGQQLFDAIFGGSEGTNVYRSLLDAAANDDQR